MTSASGILSESVIGCSSNRPSSFAFLASTPVFLVNGLGFSGTHNLTNRIVHGTTISFDDFGTSVEAYHH